MKYTMKTREQLRDEFHAYTGEDSDISDDVKANDTGWWRRALYAYHKKLELLGFYELEKATMCYQYDTKIDKLRQERDEFKALLKATIQKSDFKTKAGGFSLNLPDVGSISVSKTSEKSGFDDDLSILKSSELGQFFTEETVEKFDKRGASNWVKENTNLSPCKAYFVDKDGQRIEGIKPILDRSVSIKGVE